MLADRAAQIAWVLDHQADLDADFLAFFGIDLDQDDITGPRYYALAHRVSAYGGVMSARIEEQRDQQEPAPASTSSSPARQTTGDRHMELVAFRAIFPGMVSMTTAGADS